MSDALELVVSLIWIIAALVWVWEWARARAALKPLIERMQEAIRDCEEARLGLCSSRAGEVGAICPRCARTTYADSPSRAAHLHYCGYCGSALVAR